MHFFKIWIIYCHFLNFDNFMPVYKITYLCPWPLPSHTIPHLLTTCSSKLVWAWAGGCFLDSFVVGTPLKKLMALPPHCYERPTASQGRLGPPETLSNPWVKGSSTPPLYLWLQRYFISRSWCFIVLLPIFQLWQSFYSQFCAAPWALEGKI